MAAEHLIVFVKNPIPGQVKTRIARTVGDDQAVAVYQHLLRYTQGVVRSFKGQCVIYYGDFINPEDGWTGYQKYQQRGNDLGERMSEAFQEQFSVGAERVVIVGSDCFDITPEHLKQAFDALKTTDIVLGPAIDGGYYLLGMTQFQPFLFENMPWSQSTLCQLTEAVIRQYGLTYSRLDRLMDIDEWTDYEAYLQRVASRDVIKDQ